MTLYLLTQIMFNNYLYKLRYLSTLFENCCLYLQLTVVWSYCLTKLDTRSLWVAFKRELLVCSVHTVLKVLSIITYIMFSFILYNTSTPLSTPMSQVTFLLKVNVCMFIMNKSISINRFELLDGPSVRKICKENYSVI